MNINTIIALINCVINVIGLVIKIIDKIKSNKKTALTKFSGFFILLYKQGHSCHFFLMIITYHYSFASHLNP